MIIFQFAEISHSKVDIPNKALTHGMVHDTMHGDPNRQATLS